ncbi:MAG: glycosyltransferase family A protein [Robiginitomaculum sp.]
MTKRPALSILIPFYHDDPTSLLSALISQTVEQSVEVLLYDDGTSDAEVNARLRAIAKGSALPVTLMLEAVNKGRSAARNALFARAKSDWVLFLDADMMPETDSFLQTYLSAIKGENCDVIFGGFKMSDKPEGPDTALHHAFSKTSDCLSAQERSEKGPQYVCSSNLAVRASVLKAEPFDTGFKGWGWEDSEWAARIAKSYRLLHIDNAAYHLGLEGTQTLLNRFRDSADNYRRFTDKHQELAQSLTLYKMTRRLGAVPGQALMRPVLSMLVANRLKIVPMRLRLLALKLWRASWYAQSFKAARPPFKERAA